MNTIFKKSLFGPGSRRSVEVFKGTVIRPPGERNTSEGCEYLDDRIRSDAPGLPYSRMIIINNKTKNKKV